MHATVEVVQFHPMCKSKLNDSVAWLKSFRRKLLCCIEMLAPRKKLWSTPPEVIEAAINLLQLTNRDILYDIGAGDCRFLLRCLESTESHCIGVEIDDVRAEEGRINITSAGFTDHRFSIITGNALDQVRSRIVNYLRLIAFILRNIDLSLQTFYQQIRIIQGRQQFFFTLSQGV